MAFWNDVTAMGFGLSAMRVQQQALRGLGAASPTTHPLVGAYPGQADWERMNRIKYHEAKAQRDVYEMVYKQAKELGLSSSSILREPLRNEPASFKAELQHEIDCWLKGALT